MATDWAKMSVSELKAELISRGLESGGKKTDMVTRLKEFEEEAKKNVTNGEETVEKDVEIEEEIKEEETADDKNESKPSEDKADKGDDTVETEDKEKDEKRTKWWVHFIGGKKIDKYKNLHCVQSMGDAKRRKDMLTLSKEFRVRAYPFSIAELNDPTVREVMLKSANFNVNFHPLTNAEGEREIVGLLVLNLAKKVDVEDVMETLKSFKDDMKVHHSANEADFEEFNNGWKKCHTGVARSEESLILIPKVADGVKEETLWQWFPSASEIYLLGSKKAPVYVGGQYEVREQSAYAYVQFANFEAAKDAVAQLNEKGPDREDVRQMNLISFTRIVEYMKDKIPKVKGKLEKSIFSAEPVATRAKSARQTNRSPATQGQTGKKTFGVASTRRQTRPGFQQQQSRPRGGMAPRRGMAPLMGGPPRRQMQQPQPLMGGGPSEEEQGMAMLGEIISSLGGVQNTADVVSNLMNQGGGTRQQGYDAGPQVRRNQSGGPQGRGRMRGQGQQQGMRRSPKRTLSPSTDQPDNKRRRSGGFDRGDTFNQRGNQGYGVMAGGGGYDDNSQYSAQGGFARRQDSFGQQQQGYGGGRSDAYQGQGGADNYEPMDVVSRIVRASKELKEAIGTKRTQSAGYGGVQAGYGGGANMQGYGASEDYGYNASPYGGSGYQ